MLQLEEVKPLGPKKGEAVIKVLSTGLSFADSLQAKGKHIFNPTPPFVPCRDVCGVVTAVGEGSSLSVGETVFGSAGGGSLREEAIVTDAEIYKAPQGLNPHVLAGLELNYGTTIHGLKDVANLRQGERLCVLGASGAIGISAIEVGKAMGAVVVACASTAEKLAACKEAGADVVINYAEPGFKERIKKEAGGQLDVVYDPVGGEYAEPALRALGFGGRYLVVGFAAGGDTPNNAIPKVPLNLALLNERQIQGVLWGAWKSLNPQLHRKNMYELVDMLRDGRLKPRPPLVYPLDAFKEAMALVTGRKAIGKVCCGPTTDVTPAARL